MKPERLQRLKEDAKLQMGFGVRQSVAQLLADHFKDDNVPFAKGILVTQRFTEVLPTAIMIAREKIDASNAIAAPLPWLGHQQLINLLDHQVLLQAPPPPPRKQ